MSTNVSMPPASPDVQLPEVKGVMAKSSKGSLSSETPLLPSGMAIRTLEQGMAVAMYLVQGQAAPKGWTAAQVFLAMQAGLEHGLGYTGGIQSFVIINNMPSWRGQAAIGKIRASRVLEPGTLEFGCDEFGTINGQPALRGWARARRVGDSKTTERFFTQQEAIDAKLWSAGENWTKFKRRMLMWRAVGFLTKDLFPDVLGNFPIAEELLGGDLDDGPVSSSRQTVSVLATAAPALNAASDPLLAEVAEGSAEPATPAQVINVLTDDDIKAKLRQSVAAHEAAMAFADGLSGETVKP